MAHRQWHQFRNVCLRAAVSRSHKLSISIWGWGLLGTSLLCPMAERLSHSHDDHVFWVFRGTASSLKPLVHRNSHCIGAAISSGQPFHRTAVAAKRLTVQQNANNSICSGSRPRAISIKADCHRKLTGPCLAHRTQRRLMDDTPPEHSLEAN